MAQIIMCDPHGMAHPADWLITRMADGEVQAYCNEAFLEFVTMAASSAADDEADETDAQAADRLQAAGQLTDEQEAELDAAAIEARIGGPTAIEATDDAIREHPLEDIEVAGIGTVPSIDTAHVVRRGQSKKARRARTVAIQHSGKHPDVQWADPGSDDAGGPDDDEDKDEDEATP